MMDWSVIPVESVVNSFLIGLGCVVLLGVSGEKTTTLANAATAAS